MPANGAAEGLEDWIGEQMLVHDERPEFKVKLYKIKLINSWSNGNDFEIMLLILNVQSISLLRKHDYEKIFKPNNKPTDNISNVSIPFEDIIEKADVTLPLE